MDNGNTIWTEQRFSDLTAYLNGDKSSLSARHPRIREAVEDEKAIVDFVGETIGLSFSETLLRMIDLRGMTDVQVYKAAKIDRRVFSKIRSNVDYQPSMKTAVRLCLAMHLRPMEAMALLEKAGLCLSRSKKEDVVVLYCLRNEIYDVDEVNEAILRLGLKGII